MGSRSNCQKRKHRMLVWGMVMFWIWEFCEYMVSLFCVKFYGKQLFFSSNIRRVELGNSSRKHPFSLVPGMDSKEWPADPALKIKVRKPLTMSPIATAVGAPDQALVWETHHMPSDVIKHDYSIWTCPIHGNLLLRKLSNSMMIFQPPMFDDSGG